VPLNALNCTIVHTTPEQALASEIGRRVRASRKAAGLRQDELATAAGVSTRAVHTIENGKATARLDTLARVLGVLGLTLELRPRTGSGQQPSTPTDT
jgi:y4mF family transcriptional regulator